MLVDYDAIKALDNVALNVEAIRTARRLGQVKAALRPLYDEQSVLEDALEAISDELAQRAEP